MTSILSAGGQLLSGGGQADAYQFNSRVERQAAGQVRDQSFLKARNIESQVGRTAGAATAAFGASGVAPTSGSSLLVMNDIATQGEMARQLALYQGRVDAFGHEQQADIDHAQATAARLGSYIGATGTLLTGAANAASGQGADLGLYNLAMSAAGG